jgi:pimeloyl-ACP methyl ester carboxylesterase
LTIERMIVMIRGPIAGSGRPTSRPGSKEWPGMHLAHLTVVVSALLGWSDITIQPSRGERLSPFHRRVAGIDRPSDRTMETLRRYDLEREYHRDVNRALLRIEKFAQQRAEAELVYALAELSWIEGKQLDRWRNPQALDRFLDAAAYAHDFLLDPNPVLAEGRSPSDPRFRLAMDIYNAAVDRLIRAAMTKGQIQPQNGKVIAFKFHRSDQKLQIVLRDSPWNPADVHKILLASDFEVSGLSKDFHQYGLGVPLIGVRETQSRPDERSPAEPFYPGEMAFPLTAFLVPNFRLQNPNVDVREARVCTLWLFDPVRQRTVGEKPNVLALETDLTTPLAYMWSRTDLDRYRWTGLLRPEKGLERANLLLIRPYEPSKIPVVMVHGLISSPLAWIPMLNELLRDPAIQQNYQFLLYMYPTGVPIPIAAASLRESLIQARQLYNPDGRDPAFNRMVLLGHSMGGLLSHMMAVKSDDKLWRLYSDRSFESEIIGPRDVLDELRRYLFFPSLPFVSRVVFLATPHLGSDFSRGMVGRVGTSLISEPDHIHKLLDRLVKDNPDAFDSRRFRRFPTSIETLEPNSPILQALLSMQPSTDVVFHSIIGSKSPTGVAQSTDGVVPYSSAHLEGVPERVVRSDHGVQKAPEAIIEVRRILREHLGIGPNASTPDVQQARGLKGSASGRLDPQAPLR